MQEFAQAFPLTPHGTPAVAFSKPENCSPSNTFDQTIAYGLRTGSENGIWVLDLDQKKGKDGLSALTEFAAGREIPDTLTVRTPSGGFHLYFTWVDGVRNRQALFGKESGVDVRGHNGYVRLGGAYTVGLDAPIAEAPEWLVAAVKAGKEETEIPTVAHAIGPDHPDWAYRRGLAEVFIATEPPVTQGQGEADAQTWKMALRLTRTYELPIETCLELLDPWDQRCTPPGYCKPVWPHKLKEAATRGTGPTGLPPQGFELVRDPGSSEPEKVPDPQAATPEPNLHDWRRRFDPAHPYEYSPAYHAGGGTGRCAPIGHNELVACVAGPGAVQAWRGVWQYDEFARRVIAVNPPLKLDAEPRHGGRLTKVDVINFRTWCGSQGLKVAGEQAESAIRSAAATCSFHPVRDYLRERSAPTTCWLDDLATRCFNEGAPPEANLFVRKWLIGCVARIMRPGCQFDTVLTLVGEAGGERKSSWLAALAPTKDWYRSHLPPVEDTRSVGMAISGHWIIELGELAQVKRTSVEAMKEFIIRLEEKYNEKYETSEAVVKRQCGLAATTNSLEFLDCFDAAFRRRFWPIEVTKRIDTTWLEAHRDELWAEAIALYDAGEAWWFEDEAAVDATKARFVASTPVAEILAAFLEDPRKRVLLNGKSATEIGQTIFGVLNITPQQRDGISKFLNKDPRARPKRSGSRRWYEFPEDPSAKSAGDGFFGSN